MKTVTNINEWLNIKKSLAGKTIGFVPTMGNLHAGHLALCAQSKVENDITVVSIFVNPTQFNQLSDFDLYPRTLADDQALLEIEGVDYLLLPTMEELYPDQYTVQVAELALANELEGEYRPGHFTGMLTVVLKLLNIASATNAYFGEKDYQQMLLVTKMVQALFVPTNIVACETRRAEDGLALSSRNSRLTPAQRQLAVEFPKLMQGNLSDEEVIAALSNLGFKVDYVCQKWGRRLGAVWLDQVRLIDNLPLGEH